MDQRVEVLDMAVAAFLILRKVEVVDVIRKSRKAIWVFKITKEEFQVLRSEYLNSELMQFYQNYQSLRSDITR